LALRLRSQRSGSHRYCTIQYPVLVVGWLVHGGKKYVLRSNLIVSPLSRAYCVKLGVSLQRLCSRSAVQGWQGARRLTRLTSARADAWAFSKPPKLLETRECADRSSAVLTTQSLEKRDSSQPPSPNTDRPETKTPSPQPMGNTTFQKHVRRSHPCSVQCAGYPAAVHMQQLLLKGESLRWSTVIH
jgi:hypothetical protein